MKMRKIAKSNYCGRLAGLFVFWCNSCTDESTMK